MLGCCAKTNSWYLAYLRSLYLSCLLHISVSRHFQERSSTRLSLSLHGAWIATRMCSHVSTFINGHVSSSCLDSHNAVKLTATGGTAYINASPICVNGLQHFGVLYSTQGPLESTAMDFWRLVYESRCSHIVMLTKAIENRRHVTPSIQVSLCVTCRIFVEVFSLL
jgi:Protein-tyrosine phosphatase